jgi:hypothetical protein
MLTMFCASAFSLAACSKAQTYCQIFELNHEIEQEENPAKTEELSRTMDYLEEKLGPEFMALVHGLSEIDPHSQDALEIRVVIESLANLCED